MNDFSPVLVHRAGAPYAPVAELFHQGYGREQVVVVDFGSLANHRRIHKTEDHVRPLAKFMILDPGAGSTIGLKVAACPLACAYGPDLDIV